MRGNDLKVVSWFLRYKGKKEIVSEQAKRFYIWIRGADLN